MNIDDLLEVNVSEFKPAPSFPGGTYKMIVAKYELLPFSWKSGASGIAYCPTVRAIESIELQDDDNPEIQEEQRAKLEAYGDWTKREFRSASESKEKPGVTEAWCNRAIKLNFPIFETDTEENVLGFMNHVSSFYLRDPDTGEQSGFVYDVLGLDYPDGAKLNDVFEATINREFIATMVEEPNTNDPSKPPNINISDVSAVVD